MKRQILILGEHDKGLGVPFHPRTLSGGRLRRMLLEVGLEAILGNAYTSDGHPNNLHDAAEGMTVVALGIPARKLCKAQEIPYFYLPHPACRSRWKLDQLRVGLSNLAMLATPHLKRWCPRHDGRQAQADCHCTANAPQQGRRSHTLPAVVGGKVEA